MRRVVDASAFVDAVLPTPRQDAALTAFSGYELWAPSILDLEVTSALWRLERSSTITHDEAEQGVEALTTAPIRRLSVRHLTHDAWNLRMSLRISDAFYAASARMLGAELVTSDGRLAHAPSLEAAVVLLR